MLGLLPMVSTDAIFDYSSVKYVLNLVTYSPLLSLRNHLHINMLKYFPHPVNYDATLSCGASLFSLLGKPADRPADRAIYFACINFFFLFFIFLLWAKISQYLLDRFSQSLHHMVGIKLHMITTFYFFRYLKGRCHDNQFSGKNGAKLPTPLHLSLSIQNGMGYRDLNERVNSANDASISCKNFVNFGPRTPEKTGLICILFYDMAKNWHI